ncbi:DUF1254 domain-containing protein [Phyllobacterium myrsinacearum]|jgi:hypothetical protein|uniref:Carboxylesterase n=1 Tax=Phyllobacterium myrsinacearum TaxID=28101 RepID=A0A2S9JPH0_9HYPH|nr:DUF1254 domain-containing protein [Phyllobacterium myrsinacearum]PRD55059.1 hypothetical protein C5750_07665 [Phyllobacterium myrsinacearum]PWV90383.1 uncharacterized protein DUF1254 [Phyllobacterium myrsinacearum]RZS79783.1 uncharacterized protein DUF1254 [Phyllobacterium myrsinacearum]RZV05422.1 uncharacterized protein DUF1254 [Phyllobacterium myrsinacearum]
MFRSVKISLAVASVVWASGAFAETSGSKMPVTVDNFIRAETDHYLAANTKDIGGLGKFKHSREPVPVDKQTVIRMNRDTLYSFAVFDLAGGPVTLSLPDAGKRYMSMMVVDQDHYLPIVAYGTKPVTLTQKSVGTRYAFVAIRTLVDPNDPKDLDEVHKLQDAIKVSQKDTGKLDLPNWDEEGLTDVRNALLSLAKHQTSYHDSFGARGEVDPIQHLIGTASGWGGIPEKDAMYPSFTPEKNDGKTVYTLNVPKSVPVKAFWSISVYNAKGFFEKNDYNAYSINDITATKNADGSVTAQFGGCDGKIPNCLPIVEGWNYTVRLYRPEPTLVSGEWKLPEAKH